MAAADALSPVQFSHHPGESGTYPAVTASIAGEQVGLMHWSLGYKRPWRHLNGQITGIEVNPEHQRKGIATGMLKYARGIDPSVKHSSVSDQTEDGQAWATNTP